MQRQIHVPARTSRRDDGRRRGQHTIQQFDRIAMRSPARLALLLACVVASILFAPAPSNANASPEGALTATAGTENGKFGVSVAISGDTAVVGAPDESEGDTAYGAAYVF